MEVSSLEGTSSTFPPTRDTMFIRADIGVLFSIVVHTELSAVIECANNMQGERPTPIRKIEAIWTIRKEDD